MIYLNQEAGDDHFRSRQLTFSSPSLLLDSVSECSENPKEGRILLFSQVLNLVSMDANR